MPIADAGFAIAALIAIVLLFGVLIVVAIRAERARSAALEAAADGMGFAFAPTAKEKLAELDGFALVAAGHSKKVLNLLSGTANGLSVELFDYQYTTGGGKHQHTHKQTVARVLTGDLDLPQFSVRPEGFWHRLGNAVGVTWGDIDFDTHPAFSKAYLLKGPDEAAVRAAFGPGVLEFFEAHPGLSAEGRGPDLLVYRAGARVEPKDLRSLLELAFEALAAFRRPADGG